MSIFSDIEDALKTAANAVADTATQVVTDTKEIGEKLADQTVDTVNEVKKIVS